MDSTGLKLCGPGEWLIEKHGTDWEAVYKGYGELRKVNTDAICDMAQENFYEMRDATAKANAHL